MKFVIRATHEIMFSRTARGSLLFKGENALSRAQERATCSKLVAILLLAITVSAVLPNVASACPMCKAAAEQDENQPKAYMYSILFMLAMPAVIFGSFGYGIYRMNQRENDLSSLDEQLHAMQEQRTPR